MTGDTMKFIIATNNKKKLREMREILDALGVSALSLSEAGIESDAEETGTTFEENSFIKAQEALKKSGVPSIADDSGLMVDALGGAPGVYSARYGGEKLTNDEERYKFLLENMKDVPKEKRSARYVSVITCLFPDGRKIVARGETEGEILFSPRGNGGFGYDPIFFVPSENASMAELSAERKNEISHRGKALSEMSEKLNREL